MRLGAGSAVKKKKPKKPKPLKKLQVPRTIWVGWCHTCGAWLDETEAAKYSIDLVLHEHPEHFDPEHVYATPEMAGRPCHVEVIPFRADRKNARAVAPKKKAEKKAISKFFGVKINFTP